MRKLPLWRRASLIMLPALLWGWAPAGFCDTTPQSRDPAVDPPPPSEFAVVGVRAYYYLQDSGRIGKEDLATGKVATVNTPIGVRDGDEDDAGASGATWVMVDLERRPARSKARQGLLLTAKVPGRTLLEKRLDVGQFFTEKDRVSIPFLVYGTGCEELKLRAVLSTTGRKEKQVMESSVPFTCNE